MEREGDARRACTLAEGGLAEKGVAKRGVLACSCTGGRATERESCGREWER